MKKLIGISLLLAIIVSCFASCNSHSNNYSHSKPGRSSNRDIVGSDSVSSNLSTPQPDINVPSSDGNLPQSNGNFAPEGSTIGVERAKEIALEKAEISADGVFFDRVELDYDRGVWHYEVEFRKDRIEYDADIKADDGLVLSFEKDFDD